jgi:hypothetical protein
MNHPQVRQLGLAGLEGSGQIFQGGRRRRRVRADIAGDDVFMPEFPGYDLPDLIELYNGGLICHSSSPKIGVFNELL